MWHKYRVTEFSCANLFLYMTGIYRQIRKQSGETAIKAVQMEGPPEDSPRLRHILVVKSDIECRQEREQKTLLAAAMH